MRFIFLALLCTFFAAATPARAAMDMSHTSLTISPVYMQALGIQTAPLALHDFGQDIPAYGTIAPSTRGAYQVSMQTKGWIRALPISALGDAVKKGDLLFTYYSPDLMSAQADYLSARKTGFKPAISEERLRVFGMDDKAIALLKQQGNMLAETPFHAPADGMITALPARKGSFIAEGGLVMTIQDFSTVWVYAHVPLKDLPFLKKDTPATITLAQSGQKFTATIAEILPRTDAQSREGIVRLVVPNPNGDLKTGAPVDVVFHAGSHKRLAVPDQAILYDSMGAYVFLAEGGGMFKAVMVATGVSSAGMTEITYGLAAGQKIVTSGQFMLDAESNLQNGMASMDMGDMDMKGMNHGQ